MSLLHPHPSRIAYVILAGDSQWKIYGDPTVLASASSTFPPISKVPYYLIKLPYLYPRPFIWIWYVLNGVTRAPLRHLHEIIQAYHYLLFFRSENLEPWWKLMTDRQAIFPTYLSPESIHYRDELSCILSGTSPGYLLPPTSRLTSFDKNYLGLYPPGERNEVGVPSLSHLQPWDITRDYISEVVVIRNTEDNPRMEMAEASRERYLDIFIGNTLLPSRAADHALHELKLCGEEAVSVLYFYRTKEIWVCIGSTVFCVIDDELESEGVPLSSYWTLKIPEGIAFKHQSSMVDEVEQLAADSLSVAITETKQVAARGLSEIAEAERLIASSSSVATIDVKQAAARSLSVEIAEAEDTRLAAEQITINASLVECSTPDISRTQFCILL